MYKRIMVPVDLAHSDKIGRSVGTAADLARLYGADLVLVGASGNEPSKVAHTPAEFEARLAEFGAAEAERRGVPVATEALHLHDLTVELDRALINKAGETGADLIVMASHVPGAAEYLFGSNAGHVAQHAKVSVMIVRG